MPSYKLLDFYFVDYELNSIFECTVMNVLHCRQQKVTIAHVEYGRGSVRSPGCWTTSHVAAASVWAGRGGTGPVTTPYLTQ